jgi:16S rRNA (uracil1498-N3)-methyltransferase
MGSRRLKPQDRISVIDGAGVIAEALIRATKSRGHEVSVEIVSRVAQPISYPRIHLAAAMPKGERQRILLDMGTQLGMASFTPLLCTRSIVKPSTKARGRWRRTCLEACKQSRQAYLPEIHGPTTPEEFADRMRLNHAGIFVAHTTGEHITDVDVPADEIALLIGPEGGYTEKEITALRSLGALPVSLGMHVLRVETAAVVGLSCLKIGYGYGRQSSRN